MTRFAPWVENSRLPGLTAVTIAAYAMLIVGGVLLWVRPVLDAPAVERFLIHAVTVILLMSGITGLPSAWLAKVRWERVSAVGAAAATIILLVEVVLLDVLPSWPPLARPVPTVVGLTVSLLFWTGRLIDLREEPSTDLPLPVEVAIARADDLRGHSDA